MKIAIIGPGAMGLLIAGFLKKSGNDVWLLDKNQQRAQSLRKNCIRIEGISGEHSIKINSTHNPLDIKEPDLIIICVKAYDTEDAVKFAKPAIGQNSLVLTLQNGVGNAEIISEIAGQDRVLAGITSHGSTLLSEGSVRHAGIGDTIIGRWGKSKKGFISRQRLYEVAAAFKASGFETKTSENVKDLIWSKLLVNVGINALTAITGLQNGKLVEIEPLRHIMKQAVLEASKIAKKKKIELIYSDPIKKVESVCAQTAQNYSSMLQDVLKKRKTEIDYINGAIVREGENLEIPTPVNETLANLVKGIESANSLKNS